MIKIYINIATTGEVKSVLSDLINRINKSHLKDNSNEIFLIINGDKTLLNLKDVDEKYTIVDTNSDISKCEFPTLDLIWQHSQNIENNFKILYLHTKGVSRNNPNISDWVNLLSYFNIDRWEERLVELENNDCTGINFGGNSDDIRTHPGFWGYGKTPLHYSGNFWWANSSHIKKLPNPIQWMPDMNYSRWRMMCEMWLCQKEGGRYHNAFSSKVDHYVTPYPENFYKNN